MIYFLTVVSCLSLVLNMVILGYLVDNLGGRK